LSPTVFNRTNMILGLVQGFYWMASCVFVSFLVRLLHGYGYNDYQTGITLTFASLASLIVQPLLGRLADRVKSVRRLLISCLLTAIVAALLLNALYRYTLLVYGLILIIFGSFRSLVYIIDLWSLSVDKSCKEFSYGFTRSFGAVFYAVSAVFYGSAIDRFGTSIIVPCFCVFSSLVVIMAMFVKTSRTGDSPVLHERSLPLSEALKILFTNKAYVVLLLSYTLIEMSCIANQNYLTRKFDTASFECQNHQEILSTFFDAHLFYRAQPSQSDHGFFHHASCNSEQLSHRAVRLRPVYRSNPVLHEQHTSPKSALPWYDTLRCNNLRPWGDDRQLHGRQNCRELWDSLDDEIPRHSVIAWSGHLPSVLSS